MGKHWNRLTLAAAGLALLLGSCAPFAPRRRPEPAGVLPDAFSRSCAGPERPDRWWSAFSAPELTALVDRALADNLDLKQAWARLVQARELAVQAGAALLPTLDGTAGWTWARRKTEATRGDGHVKTQTRSYSLGLAASYEVDLWARIRSQRQAARLNAVASRDDLEAAAMTLAAQVTEAWLQIAEQRADKALLEEQLKNNKTYLELMDLRFRMGQATALDIDEQQQAVARVEAQIPLTEAQEEVLRQQLAVLLGELPNTDLALNADAMPELPPLPPAGMPAEVLAQRPDVRAALVRLESSDYRVAAAKADRLPSIQLTGSTAYNAAKSGDVFDMWYQTLGASLVAPLFDGRRRASEVRRTKAVVEERVAAYRETVLNAIQEVEEALVREQKQHQHIAALEKQLKFARMALDGARERYTKGQTDYLRVLAALTAAQGLERDLIRTRRELLVFRVNLYRALGGQWTRELAPMAGASKAEDATTTEGPS